MKFYCESKLSDSTHLSVDQKWINQFAYLVFSNTFFRVGRHRRKPVLFSYLEYRNVKLLLSLDAALLLKPAGERFFFVFYYFVDGGT